MIIYPSDVHEDFGKAKMGVLATALALGVECNCNLMSQWLVKIDGNELKSFLELAREEAESCQ